MQQIQSGILQAIPQHATYLTFTLKPNAGVETVTRALSALLSLVDGRRVVLGIGASLMHFFGGKVAGLREFNGVEGSKVNLPVTPGAVWCWCREDERGELVHQRRRLRKALAEAFDLLQALDAFKVDSGRDLTGYEDGTENPEQAAAVDAAIVQGQGGGLDGSSFVAIQQWQHGFEQFEAIPEAQQDNMMGRRKSDNEELEEAPESAHVKRTAQEDFTPEAFVLRRSMPWSAQDNAGLHFVAFGNAFYAFEAQLRRMSGAEDGIVDALFSFSQPITGAYFWCPPMHGGRLDLSALRR